MYVQQIPWKENYDEAQMPGYTLPEVLRCQDGTVITDAETWRRKRRPELLPMDQHELIALIAPRTVAVHSASEDQWADSKGEYLSAYHAGPAFKLFGKTPLASETPPEIERAVGTDVSYYCYDGKHDMLQSDWEHYLSIADCVFGKPDN